MFHREPTPKKWRISPPTNEDKSDRLNGLWSSRNSEEEEMDIPLDPFFEYQFRVILIGDSGVGKSSLLRCFTDGTFAEVSDPTVGVDFFARIIKVADGTPIKLQLWDTAGHERFRSITKSYYRNSVGCLLVFDVCCRSSFLSIGTWMSEAKKYIDPYKAVFILVGCKRDMPDTDAKNREVNEPEARAFANFHNIPYVETSAKSGLNVEDAFAILTQSIYDKIETGEYKVDGNWDGIKRGFFPLNNNNNASSSSSSTNSRRIRARGNSVVNLREAQPESKLCC